MIICAFDLATATGCCDGPVGGKPRLWSWYLSDAGPERPRRLHALAEFLNKYFAQEPCDAVVYEAAQTITVMAEIGATDDTVAFLRGAIGVLEERCCAHGKAVQGLGVQDARASVLGWRINNKKRSGIATKKRVLQDVRVQGIKPETDNEADAWVMWMYACCRNNPRVAIAMTPLFREAGA
jgi:hypothetical protein